MLASCVRASGPACETRVSIAAAGASARNAPSPWLGTGSPGRMADMRAASRAIDFSRGQLTLCVLNEPGAHRYVRFADSP